MTSGSSSPDASKPARAERLFRSAVTAYCALVRPLKRDAERLDDLTLPLLSMVSAEARRFAAAALSEAGTQPTMLVRRLAEEPLEISAPLLVRSPSLTDVELIGLIGRHGIGHARAIGRRANLNANIAKLIKALGAASGLKDDIVPTAAAVAEPASPAGQANTHRPREHDAAEDVRVRLREMMRPSRPAEAAPALPAIDWDKACAAYPRLLTTALTGNEALFHTAVADALQISFGTARTLDNDEAPGLTVILKALDLAVEQAFLVAVLAYPYGLVGHASVERFVRRYRSLESDAARVEVSDWRDRVARRRAALADMREPDPVEAANDAGAVGVLRAS